MFRLATAASSLLLVSCVMAAEPNPPELGTVVFQRDWAKAVAASKATTKPLFVLFDEVPG
jgi:hypothetical protein